MNKKNIAILAFLFVFASIVYYFFFLTEKGNPAAPADQASKYSSTIPETNFVETGNLVKDNPGLEAGMWYFVYDKPGAAALKAKVQFENYSACVFESAESACDASKLSKGDRVKIEGYKEDDTLWVKRLEK